MIGARVMRSRPVRVAGRIGVDALRAVGTALAPMGRRAPEIVASIGIVLSTLAVLVLVGAARNDATIESDRSTAVAEVLDGSSAQRAYIRFTAADGAVLTPEHGVFYPRGLKPGDLVRVEYDRSQPDLVRVEGRDWTVGLLPVVIGVAVIWAVCGPAAYGLGRLRRRRRAGSAVTTPGPESDGPGDGAESARPGREVVGAGAP